MTVGVQMMGNVRLCIDSPEVPGSRRQVEQVLVVASVLHQVPGEALVDQLRVGRGRWAGRAGPGGMVNGME